jgi:hypothetical protein
MISEGSGLRLTANIVGQTFQPAGWPDSFRLYCALSWEGEAPAEPLWIILAADGLGSSLALPKIFTARFARRESPTPSQL